MDELQFWKQKVIQFFHDPAGKPFASYPGSGGHPAVAKKLYERFTNKELKFYNRHPDWAAAGADRPMLNQPRGNSPVQLGWAGRPILTHPLWPAQWQVDTSKAHPNSAKPIQEELLEEQLEALDRIKDPLSDWQNAAALEKDFARLWRRFRDELVAGRAGNLLWEEMPADGRIPDHSIWDHLRITTALAFLPERKQPVRDENDPQCPWLLRFSLHSVQRFIEEARTSRDLWVGSFLLSDLIWHAMQPIVRRYGHDCIIHPDLRGNPLVDNWLAADDPEMLPDTARDAASFASLLPSTFTAVVPRGEAGGYLLPLEELARQCQDAVRERWRELAGIVATWLEKQVGPGLWQDIWRRQHEHVIGASWSAVAWLPPEKLNYPESLRRRALPAQRADFRGQPDAADLEAMKKRKARLAPWLPADTWNHYELAREVYAHTHLDWHQMERGFDYALTHHQLATRHALRRAQSRVEDVAQDEPGEKCTCCGRRQALTKLAPGSLIADHQEAKAFWSNAKLDPEESGGERLCGVCALKRFLVKAGKDERGRLSGINPVWAGRGAGVEDQVLDRDGEPRVPFPSTATLAAQKFIEAVAGKDELAPLLREVVRAHRDAKLTPTSFPRALPRLAAAANTHPNAAEFLKREAEEVLFPEAIEGQARGHEAKGDKAKAHDLRTLAIAVRKLRQEAKNLTIEAPNKRIAVLAMDGDRIGRLLLGEKDVIHTTWKDVLHPEAVNQITSQEKPRQRLHDAGWLDLQDARRLTGPSLHAYISRALAAFSHHIVPWVVEREFSGRLIYAGGDELLCLVPGDEALGLAARLQQLFSAPWIVDTDVAAGGAWNWRRRDWIGKYDQGEARRRFALPIFQREQPVAFPITDPAALHPHVVKGAELPRLPVEGPVIPLLGGGHSLSAGIAFGHYKTPLSQLLARARRMLNEEAKGRVGGATVALSHASRGGEKNTFAMPWGRGGDGAHAALTAVIDGFNDGSLPGRLPYKLRELAPLLTALPEDEEKRETWLKGLFGQALGEGKHSHAAQAAFALWCQGLRLEEGERATGGLLLCRALAGTEEESE